MQYQPFILIVCFMSILGLGCISNHNSSNTEREERFLSIKKEVLKHSNLYRKSINKNSLSVKSNYNSIAQKHSDDMAAGKVPFSHKGFQRRFNAVKKQSDFPVTVAENLYATTYPELIGKEAVKAWIGSAGHRKNLQGNFRYSGIGVSRSSSGEYFVVQLYVGISQ